MQDLRQIEQKVDKVLASSNARVQSEVLNSLISQVREYADAARNAKELSNDRRNVEREIEHTKNDIKELEREISKGAEDKQAALSEKQTNLSEAQALLQKTQQAERIWETQRQVLRDVQKNVEALRSELGKII